MSPPELPTIGIVRLPHGEGLDQAISASLREVTKLSGRVERVLPGALPNDGKVIADERSYEA